mgnify:CR=1 FL=1
MGAGAGGEKGAGSKEGAPAGRLSTVQAAIFGFSALPHAFVMLPITTLLPTIYAQHTSVTLAEIGAVAALARIFDALNDPFVGYLSDRTRTRIGSRKPWLLGAIVVCMASITQLFQPPPDATSLYYAVWSCILFTGFTMFEIPKQAWSSELTRDYRERSRIMMFVALFNIMGSLILYITPVVSSLVTGGTTKMGPETLEIISYLYLVLMPLGLLADRLRDLLLEARMDVDHVPAGVGRHGGHPPNPRMRLTPKLSSESTTTKKIAPSLNLKMMIASGYHATDGMVCSPVIIEPMAARSTGMRATAAPIATPMTMAIA